MSFDDDMRERIANQTPTVTNLDAGAAAAARSAGRRKSAALGVTAMALVALVGVGAWSLAGDSSNEVDLAGDSGTPTEAVLDEVEVDDGDEVNEETSGASEEIEPGDDESDSTPVTTEPPEETEDPDEEPDEEPDPDETEAPTEDPSPVSTLGDTVVFAVANVASDDTLNVRMGAGTDFDVVSEFGFDETGIVRTGSASEFVGTSEWIEVFLPVAGGQGWVNSSFLEPFDVVDSSPCAFNGTGTATASSWTNTEGGATADAVVMSVVDSYRFGSCIRTVIQGFDGFSSSNDPADTISMLPNDITVTGDTSDGISVINFGPSVMAAETAQARFSDGTVSQSTYLYREQAGDLAGAIYGVSSTLDVRFDNTNGTIIIDVSDTRAATAGVEPLFDDGGIVVTSAFAGPDGVNLVGFARPFEANLGVEVVLGDGPLDVEWTGAIRSEVRSTNGVMTTDWSSGWGVFDFTIKPDPSVDPFEMVVRIDPSGGAADDPTLVDLILDDLLN